MNFLPNHPVPEHTRLTFLPQLNTVSFISIPRKTKNFGSVYLKLSINLYSNSIYRPNYFTADELLFNKIILCILGITELRDLRSSLGCS